MKINMPLMLSAASLLMAGPACAAEMLATYTGTIVDRMGDVAGTLDGRSFTATFIYDTSRGSHYRNDDIEGISGGAAHGVPMPVLSYSMRIDGMPLYDVTETPDDYAAIRNDAAFWQGNPWNGGYTYHEVQHDRRDHAGNLLFFVWLKLEGEATTGAHLETPYDSTVGPFVGSSSFIYNTYVDGQQVRALSVALRPTAISIAYAPEPAGWAMMIAGFGAVGASLRRRPNPQWTKRATTSR